MKNKLVDLNNHLFAQMERVSEEDITPEELEKEIKRSKVVCSLAVNIIGNAKVALDGMIAINDGLIKSPPAMLGPGYVDEG